MASCSSAFAQSAQGHLIKNTTKNHESGLLKEQCLCPHLGQHGAGNAREEGAPKNGLFWGKLQVVWLKWKCTSMPTTVNKHDYPTKNRVKDRRNEGHVQCNCILLIAVKKAEEQAKAELEVEIGYFDLFEIDSSQSQNNPPSLPP
jgi:hypothetical protein